MAEKSPPKYPKLAGLLRVLRSGLKTFTLADIRDYLQGRDDSEFKKKFGSKAMAFAEAIEKLVAASPTTPTRSDSGNVSFLLYHALSDSKGWTDSDIIGEAIVKQLQRRANGDDETCSLSQ